MREYNGDDRFVGLVGQDSVLATVTEYLIVGTGEEFKRQVFMMEPPLCFLLFIARCGEGAGEPAEEA